MKKKVRDRGKKRGAQEKNNSREETRRVREESKGHERGAGGRGRLGGFL